MGTEWLNEVCPDCDKDNWVNLGDMSDLTAPDVDGCICWNCGFEIYFAGAKEYYQVLNQDIETHAFLEDGQEYPI
tara:strand:- start:5246 stop:5470 length:225 start_codon:yes stop_codon:yes gene_type:complete